MLPCSCFESGSSRAEPGLMPVTLPRPTTDLTVLALECFTFDATCPCHIQSAMDLRQLFFFPPCMFLWFVKFRGNKMHILSRSFYVFPLFSVNFFCISRSVVPAWQVENSKCCCKFPRGDWSLIYLWTDAVPLFPVFTWLNKVLPNFFSPLLFILNSLLKISCSWYTDTENT